MSRAETSLWERRVVATEGGRPGRALRTSSAGKHDEASEAVRRTRASGAFSLQSNRLTPAHPAPARS
jgi:hypothetical protein